MVPQLAVCCSNFSLVCTYVVDVGKSGENELPLYFENFNLQDIQTPVDAEKFKQILTESGYDKERISFLYQGFKECFSLQYEGNLKRVTRTAPNLKFRVGSPLEMWNKIIKEVELGRYAGPFETPPFKYFVQSPIGLVPKDKGTKTRLIFHLSYPRNGDLVNSGIPKRFCTVCYPDFEEAVKLCVKEGKFCHVSKLDMTSAFRQVPLRKDQWYLLVMRAPHPSSNKIYYFVDKCLPFGSSISCAIFQAISNAVAYVVAYRARKPNVNYLDDFLFVAYLKSICVCRIFEVHM